MDAPVVVAVNLQSRTAFANDGSTLPITNLIDATREETDDPDEAVAFVCGPDSDGNWHAWAVADFQPATVH